MDLEIRFDDGTTGYLEHHGILGQKWGVKNGPPYPLGSGKYSTSEKKKISEARSKSPKGRYSKAQFTKGLGRSSGQQKTSAWDGLSDGQKKAVKIALASAAVVAVAGVGLYAANKAGLLDEGAAAVSQMFSKTKPSVSVADDVVKAAHPFEESLPKLNGTMSMEEHLSKANPLFGSFGSTDNCTSCSTVLEMRLRGYDVEAVPMIDGQTSFSIAEAFGARVHSPMYEKLTPSEYKDVVEIAGNSKLDAVARVEKLNNYFIAHPQTASKIAAGSAEDGTKGFLRYINKCPDGARGNLIGTLPTGTNHSMFWRKEGGKVVIYDGQSGERYADSMNKLLGMSNTQWFRTDNKQINWDVMQKQVRAHNPYYDSLPTSRKYTYKDRGGYSATFSPWANTVFPKESRLGGFTDPKEAVRFAKAEDLIR